MDNFDDIVFLHKNKSYGAYVMRKRYEKNLSLALLITFFVFITVNFYILYTSINSNQYADMQLREEIADYEQFMMLKNIDSVMIKSVPPKKKISNKINSIPQVVDSIKKEIDTIRNIKLPEKPLDSLKTDSTLLSDSTVNGTPNGKGNADIFVMASLPVFPGGNDNIAKFILENTKIPEEAYKAKIKGLVIVEYTINVIGNVTDVKVTKSVHPLLDNEAIRVVKLFPRFTPGRRNGKAVAFKVYAKFSF